jgi:hypothetical protein
MKHFLVLILLSLTLQLTATAQSNPSYASSKEIKKEKKVSKGTSGQKDRNFWQSKRSVKKFKKSVKKKDCDCPGQMTEKQRRKYRVRN